MARNTWGQPFDAAPTRCPRMVDDVGRCELLKGHLETCRNGGSEAPAQCVCGQPADPYPTVHRTDGPCYVGSLDDPEQPPVIVPAVVETMDQVNAQLLKENQQFQEEIDALIKARAAWDEERVKLNADIAVLKGRVWELERSADDGRRQLDRMRATVRATNDRLDRTTAALRAVLDMNTTSD